MKSQAHGPGSVLLAVLSSHRLAVSLLAVLIGFSLLASLIAQAPTSPVPLEQLYSPEALYLLNRLGFTDVYHSGWFISALAVFALNLVCAVYSRWSEVWKESRLKTPHAVNSDHIVSTKKHERHYYAQWGSSIGREDFRDLANAFAAGRVGKAFAVRDEGGLEELQIAAQSGRLSSLSTTFAHLSLLLVGAGYGVGAFFGFEGEMRIDEGRKSSYVEVKRGRVPSGWQVLEENGKPLPGFYKTGFEVECQRFDVTYYEGSDRPKSYTSWLSFTQEGSKPTTEQVWVNWPTRFGGYTFYQSAFSTTGQMGASLSVTDREEDAEQQFPTVAKGASYQLGDASFRVLEIQSDIEEFGAGVQIELQEGKGDPQKFWIFEKYPGFDAANRKKSGYTFVVNNVAAKHQTVIRVAKDPGVYLLWVGFAALAISLIAAFLYSHDRYWFVWKPNKVILLGSSNKMFLFEPTFERAMNVFQKRLMKYDKAAKPGKSETRYGGP